MSAANTITGHVLERGESRCNTAGAWQLTVDIALDGVPRRKAVTARAVKVYGASYADGEVCRQTAHLLRRGMRVSVTFSRASLRAGRLELADVERIATDVPAYIKPYR